MLLKTLVFCSLLTLTWSIESFPPWLKFGVSSAAYQVEGAWNASDKTESIWDRYVHKTNKIKSQDNGDVASDSYHNWKRDIQMLEELGVDFYRFSISWPRLLPTGFDNRISADGSKYYSDLIDALLEKEIEPVVTLYNWDLPQKLQDLGGWTNPLIADWFADYARVVFTLYGDRVNTWITINEPSAICNFAYSTGNFAPGLKIPDVGTYLCAKNIHLSHAKVWRLYEKEFKAKYNGKLSLCNQLFWMEAAAPDDEELTELVRQHWTGIYSHPIYSKDGGWPPAIEKAMAEYSNTKKYPRSVLPAFSKEEIEFVKGTYDFYTFNQYSSRLVYTPKEGEVQNRSLTVPELNASLDLSVNWGENILLNSKSDGMKKQLLWLKKKYGDIPIFVGGNGYTTGDDVNDKDRIENYKNNLKQIRGRVRLHIDSDTVHRNSYSDSLRAETHNRVAAPRRENWQ